MTDDVPLISSRPSRGRAAVLLDRDGVLIEDRGVLTQFADARLFPCVPRVLGQLRAAGYLLIVISNQAVVARGLLHEDEVVQIQQQIADQIRASGGPALDAFYFCPHHPSADVPYYRRVCTCRKPAPGLLQQAAGDFGLELRTCTFVGDRPSDVLAGRRAGCRTVLLTTGRHLDPPIEVAGGFTPEQPDAIAPDLATAARWILDNPPTADKDAQEVR